MAKTRQKVSPKWLRALKMIHETVNTPCVKIEDSNVWTVSQDMRCFPLIPEMTVCRKSVLLNKKVYFLLLEDEKTVQVQVFRPRIVSRFNGKEYTETNESYSQYTGWMKKMHKAGRILEITDENKRKLELRINQYQG